MPNCAMTNYAKVRRNMVDCQLRTNNIESEDVLRVFETVPRERFLPAPLQGSAYVDEDLPLDGGLFMVEPLVLARLVQAAQPRPADRALIIGDATGYAAAVLAGLVADVVVTETRPGQWKQARLQWESLGLGNIHVLPGDAAHGPAENKGDGYDIIVISGSAREVPAALSAQLCDGGRMTLVVRPSAAAMGVLTLVEKAHGRGGLAMRRLADAATPYLAEFAPQPDFVF